MSFMITAYLMEKYGPLLTIPELAEVLKLKEGTVKNKISKQEITIPVLKMGDRTVFLAEDVSDYVDELRG